MKKWFVLVLAAVLLCGCGAQTVFETVEDEAVLDVSIVEQTVQLTLPPEAAVPTAQSPQGGSLYICDGYTLMVQTLSGGDLNRTMQQVTGFSADRLQSMNTKTGNITCYHTAWTAAGEAGDEVGRVVILDDGVHHYAVSVMAPAESAGKLQDTWSALLNSVSLHTG